MPHCKKTQNGNGEWVENTNWPSKRTNAQYVQDLADLEERERTGGRKVTGASFHSISRKPIIPVVTDMDHIIPPSLHILLGLVVRYFKLLEQECRRLDNDGDDLLEPDGEYYNEWLVASEIAQDAEIKAKDSAASLQHEEELLKGMQKAKSGRARSGMCAEPCDMPICALTAAKPASVNATSVSWIQCTKCGEGDDGWFHAYCVGLTEVQAQSDNMDAFVCPVCSEDITSPSDLIQVQEERVNTARTLANDNLAAYEQAKGTLETVYAEVKEKQGSLEAKLNTVLEDDVHVKRQAYHSQCFVGNHCKKILDCRQLLLNVLPDGDVKTKFMGLFGRLKYIIDLFKAEFLTDREVTTLCSRCWELGHWFPKNFPNETIPPKLHFLISHIPECALRWRTIGLLSEHGLESVHANINAISRMHCTVRDKPMQMRLNLGSHQQRSTAKKSDLKSKNVRKCIRDSNNHTIPEKDRCQGRYVKSKTDGNFRICKDCSHQLPVQ